MHDSVLDSPAHMALPSTLTLVTDELPHALRQDVEGYVHTLEFVWREIYADADTRPEQVHQDHFLFFAGVWRIWGHISGQRWIIQNSLDVAAEYGVAAISAGGYIYSSNSEDVTEIRDLYAKYRSWLTKHNLEFVTTVTSARDLLWALKEHHVG